MQWKQFYSMQFTCLRLQSFYLHCNGNIIPLQPKAGKLDPEGKFKTTTGSNIEEYFFFLWAGCSGIFFSPFNLLTDCKYMSRNLMVMYFKFWLNLGESIDERVPTYVSSFLAPLSVLQPQLFRALKLPGSITGYAFCDVIQSFLFLVLTKQQTQKIGINNLHISCQTKWDSRNLKRSIML